MLQGSVFGNLPQTGALSPRGSSGSGGYSQIYDDPQPTAGPGTAVQTAGWNGRLGGAGTWLVIAAVFYVVWKLYR